MADAKAGKPKAKEAKPVAPDEDTRYRFIGFEVYPKKTGKFWKSDAEFQEHVDKARSVKSFADWDRDFSLVRVADITTIDRIVLIFSHIILLGTMFLPWLSYWMNGSIQTASWFGVIGNLGGILGGAFEISGMIGLASVCGLLVFICTPLLGILGLVGIFMKGKSPEKYVQRLRLILRLNYIGLASWILGLILSLTGGNAAPLVNAGVQRLGESFTIVTVFQLISYGAIIPLAMFFLNSLKSNDL